MKEYRSSDARETVASLDLCISCLYPNSTGPLDSLFGLGFLVESASSVFVVNQYKTVNPFVVSTISSLVTNYTRYIYLTHVLLSTCSSCIAPHVNKFFIHNWNHLIKPVPLLFHSIWYPYDIIHLVAQCLTIVFTIPIPSHW